jgi:hypothetical protein
VAVVILSRYPFYCSLFLQVVSRVEAHWGQQEAHPPLNLGWPPSRLSRDSPENLRQIQRPAFCMKCPANLLFHNIFNHFKF